MSNRIMFLVIGTLAACAWAAPVKAEPGIPLPETSAPSEAATIERRLEAAADAFMSYEFAPGFGRVEIERPANRIVIRWKGQLPEELKSLAKSTTASGIPALVSPAALSREEISKAAYEALELAQTLTPGLVTTAKPNREMTALRVEGERGIQAYRGLLTAAQATERFGVPVELGSSESRAVSLSRQDDSAPWQGGGATVGQQYCSNAFTVIKNGQGRILSARHCTYPSGGVGTILRDGAGDRIGVISNGSVDNDVVLIDPDASPATVGKVFGGPFNASSGNSRYQFYVAGATNPAMHARVCTSGAMSGEHGVSDGDCNLMDVYDDYALVTPCNVEWGVGICEGFKFKHLRGWIAISEGDSGGPVYDDYVDNTHVGARGLISIGYNGYYCPPGTTAYSGPVCATSGFAVGIRYILQDWDATIETG